MNLASGRQVPVWAMLITAGLALAGSARADIQFFNGIQGGNQGTNNVVFTGLNDITGPAMTIRGNIQGGPLVDFIGTENLFVPSGGQSRIEAVDGGFSNIQILLTTPPGGTFTKAIFDLDALANGGVTIGVVEGNGSSSSATFSLDKNGNNFFTTIAINAQDIKTISISSTVELNKIEQVRLGGGATAVPEPSAILLLAFFSVFAFVLKNRHGNQRTQSAHVGGAGR